MGLRVYGSILLSLGVLLVSATVNDGDARGSSGGRTLVGGMGSSHKGGHYITGKNSGKFRSRGSSSTGDPESFEDEDNKARARANSGYRDPGAVDLCPSPAYVFDNWFGCRPRNVWIVHQD